MRIILTGATGYVGEGVLLELLRSPHDSIAFTLNHIWLQDHGAKAIPYPKLDEEDMQMPMAAEGEIHPS